MLVKAVRIRSREEQAQHLSTGTVQKSTLSTGSSAGSRAVTHTTVVMQTVATSPMAIHHKLHRKVRHARQAQTINSLN